MTFNLGMWPKAVSSFPKLVKAAESCKKNEWKKTIFGKDKFHKPHGIFLNELKLTIQAFLEEEKRANPGKPPSSTYEILQELDGLLIDFKSINPSHPLGYDYIFSYFRESTNLLIDTVNILLHRPKAKFKEDYGPRDENKLGQEQVDEMVRLNPAMKDSLWHKNATATSSVSQKPIKTKETFANGDVYVGEWKDGLQNGQGTYTFANGDVYEGEHKDGKQDGQGKKVFGNGHLYVGEWKDGLQNGQGTYT
ncbi:uncharacterized protein METZ01_LOCUS369930, partial [marine metagenome]